MVDIHIKSGNTPTLRLDQDGTSGFRPQIWDVAGNEAGFFIRDATNGSTLPFRIRPGAPSSAIDIAADGDVGIGTGSPAGRFHIENTAGDDIDDFLVTENGVTVIGGAAAASNADLLVKDADGAFGAIVGIDGITGGQARVDYQAGSEAWLTGTTGSGYFISEFSAAGIQLELTAGGALTITGTCTDSDGGGGVPDGCDAVFQPGYDLESIEEHAASMWEKSHLPAIGPTPEGKTIRLNVQARHFGVLNELEKAHIYIDQLNEKLKEKGSEVDELSDRLARLETLMSAEATRRNDD